MRLSGAHYRSFCGLWVSVQSEGVYPVGSSPGSGCLLVRSFIALTFSSFATVPENGSLRVRATGAQGFSCSRLMWEANGRSSVEERCSALKAGA